MRNPNHSPYNKVVVFGLDGATFRILRPWCEAGELPFLKKLIDEGSSGDLLSTIPPITAAAFVSFQTGKNPGKHGIFDFSKYVPGSYDTPIINSTMVKPKTIWQLLSAAGKKIVAITVPVTYPPKPINGAMVADFLSPDMKQACYPPELAGEIAAIIPEFEFIIPIRTIDFLGLDEFVSRLTRLAEKRAEIAKFLLKGEWDFFMLHFQDTDTGQHAFFSYIDPTHPEYTKHTAEDRAKVLGLYKRIDQLMAEIAAGFEENTLLLVMSDHGFGPAVQRIYINEWLFQQKYLRVKQGWKKRAVGLALKVVQTLDVFKLRRRFMKSRSRSEKLVIRFTQTSLIDWSQTKAYAVSGSFYARIYLNLKGREPQGIVDPLEVEKILARIKNQLLDLRDPITGQAAIKNVYFRDEIYSGESSGLLPDIVAEPARGFIFATDLASNSVIKPTPSYFNGTHEREGIVAVKGSGVRSGFHIQGADLVDLMPTILYAMGVPVPTDLDGKILSQIFETGLFENHPPTFVDPALESRAADLELSEEERDVVEERLRNLGYLG